MEHTFIHYGNTLSFITLFYRIELFNIYYLTIHFFIQLYIFTVNKNRDLLILTHGQESYFLVLIYMLEQALFVFGLWLVSCEYYRIVGKHWLHSDFYLIGYNFTNGWFYIFFLSFHLFFVQCSWSHKCRKEMTRHVPSILVLILVVSVCSFGN